MNLMLITLLTLLAILLVSLPCAIIFLFSRRFGREPRGERLQRVLSSPHYDAKKGSFQSTEPTTLMTKSEHGSVFTDFLFKRKSKRLVPKEGEVPVTKTYLKDVPLSKDWYLWFGHSSFLLCLNGKTILADPVFYMGSPVRFVNKMFPGTDIYKPKDMPEKIDYLLISHDHWDHLDYQTVKELRKRVSKVICPLGVGADFERWGYSPSQIIEMDWEDSLIVSGVRFTCLETRHFSGRGPFHGKTQRASWLIDSGERKIFFSGDGGYSGRFERFGKQYPDIDLAIMENGQYGEGWKQIHTMPYELGKEVKELSPKRFVTIHHSKFCLSSHPWDEPRKNELQAQKESGVPLIRVNIGETFYLD